MTIKVHTCAISSIWHKDQQFAVRRSVLATLDVQVQTVLSYSSLFFRVSNAIFLESMFGVLYAAS